MGRRGRHAFLDHWHARTLDLPDGDVLRWVPINDPARAPIVECFRRTSPDGSSRAVHAVEARRLLEAAGHPDAELVRLESHVGRSMSH